MYGGGIVDRSPSLADDVFALENGLWRTIGRLSLARYHLSAASDGEGKVWFLRGRQHTLETNQSLVDLVEGDEVVGLGDVPTPRGGGAGFFVPEVGACLAGGEASNTYRRVECIDHAGATTSLPGMAERRHGLGAAVLDGTVYLLLGGPVPGYSDSGTVQILDPR